MKKKITKNYLSKKNFYLIIFFVFIIQFYEGFLNTYILIKKSYEERMIEHGGFCEKQGYGFTKFINHKYKNLTDLNIPVINFLDFPTAEGYFYKTDKKNSINYIIIINPPEEDLKKKYFKNYYVIEKSLNCYFLKKK